MITPITVRNTVIGAGKIKICVPVFGKNRDEILNNTKNTLDYKPDIIEYRCDHLYPFPDDSDRIIDILCGIRSMIGDIPLIFTLRTKNQGGKCDVSFDAYQSILIAAAQSGYVDIIDIECFSFGSDISSLFGRISSFGVKTIGSHHRFDCTPSRDEIINYLFFAKEYGADIAKAAVMPHSPEDVLTLLSASAYAKEHLSIPIISMSMSSLGAVSRISGGIFGSAVTFGCAGIPSAPGQIDAIKLRKIIDALQDAK